MNIQHVLATKGTHVVTIRPDQTIREALATLVTNNVGALVVVDNTGALKGIVSERDILHTAAKNEGVFSQSVRELMTTNVIVGVPQDDLSTVAYTMTEKRIRHIPVVEHGKLLGIVSIGDVVKAQRNELLGEVDTLQTMMLSDNP
jgi:CBS domain-containing protein